MARGKVSTFGTIYKGYITYLKAPAEHTCAQSAVEPLGKAA